MSDVLLGFQNRERFLRKPFRDDDLDEDLVDLLRRILVHDAVDGEDAAEHRDGIGFIRLDIRFVNGLSDAHAAGIGVFARDDAGFGKFLDEFEGAVGVVYVVVGQFLAPELFRLGEGAGAQKFFVVIGRALMGIFAVAHVLRLLVGEGDRFGETDTQLRREIVGDHAVVSRRVGKYLILQIFLRLGRDPRPFQFGQHPFVVLGIDDDRDVLIIFRRRADHRGPADVDVFQG